VAKTKMNLSARIVRRQRFGAAAVEFAVVLPVIVLLLLGAVEFGRAVMVQHTLQEAAQAGCRLYASPDTDMDDADAIVSAALAKADITEFEIQYDPTAKAQITSTMQPVTVTVSVNYSDVSWVSAGHLRDSTITGRCTMPGEVDAVP
jgi:Flp pilus assembly protein TadG